MNSEATREYTRHDTPVVRIRLAGATSKQSSYQGNINAVALSLIGTDEIVFDRRTLKIRPAGIDDNSRLKVSKAGGFSFGRTRGINDGDLIGLYDVEQDGDFFYLSKRAND